jgi:hypothetical protein
LLVGALQRGEVRMPESQSDGAAIADGQLEALAAQHVERTLDYLAENALLEPE